MNCDKEDLEYIIEFDGEKERFINDRIVPLLKANGYVCINNGMYRKTAENVQMDVVFSLGDGVHCVIQRGYVYGSEDDGPLPFLHGCEITHLNQLKRVAKNLERNPRTRDLLEHQTVQTSKWPTKRGAR
jgi:hypothetical protein